MGKVVVVKSIFLSKLSFVVASLPNPDNNFFTSLNKSIYSFIWGSPRDRIKRKQLVQDYQQGGLKMIDIVHYCNAMKLRWLQRLHCNNKEVMWVNIFYSHFNSFCNLNDVLELSATAIFQLAGTIGNSFWKNVLETWSYVLSSYLAVDKISIRDFALQHIWFNDLFYIDGNHLTHDKLYNAGIRCINDFLNSDGSFYAFNDFCKLYDIKINFLTYFSLINCFRSKANQIFPGLNFVKQHSCVSYPSSFNVLNFFGTGCKSFYNFLAKDKEYGSVARVKWNDNLNMDIDCITWKQINLRPFIAIKDTRLQWFQYRINNRILGCNVFLHKINLSDHDLCSFCKHEPETICHLLYFCNISQAFWREFTDLLASRTKFILNLNQEVVLFGTSLNKTLNVIILLAKFYLYRCKYRSNSPRLKFFLLMLKDYYFVQKYNATVYCRIVSFDSEWKRWLPLFLTNL